MVQPRHAAQSWRVENADAAPRPAWRGWGLASELPGFRKVVGAQAPPGRGAGRSGRWCTPDGLAAVSVFIEPLEGPPRSGAHRPGQRRRDPYLYREVANHMVTVVGEAPAASVQRIANAVEFRRPQ